MAKDKSKGKKNEKKKGPSKGLSAKTFSGLNKKRMAKGTGGDRLVIKQGETVTVQFLDPISEFVEYDQHVFQDGKNWQYVPCAGDDCPLCEDEDNDVSKTSYRACTNVYSFKDKGVKVLEGPKDLMNRIAQRYERRPNSFLKRTWDISKLQTTPVSYDVEQADDAPVDAKAFKAKKIDLLKWINSQMERYFGNDMPTSRPTSLDDDDDYEEDEASYTKADLKAMDEDDLKRVAKEFKVKIKGKSKKEVVNEILAAQAEDEDDDD